jgi:hypothetical protein
MLAAAFSDSSELANALGFIIPTRYASRGQSWPEESRRPWLWQYWSQITDEAWAFYGGEYKDFLQFREKGGLLLGAWANGSEMESAHHVYAESAKGYMGIFRLGNPYATRNPVANSYDQLLTRTEAVVGIRERFQSKKVELGQPQTIDDLGREILCQINDLIPSPPFLPGEELILGLVQAVVLRLRLSSTTEEALTKTVMQQRAQGGPDA